MSTAPTLSEKTAEDLLKCVAECLIKNGLTGYHVTSLSLDKSHKPGDIGTRACITVSTPFGTVTICT